MRSPPDPPPALRERQHSTGTALHIALTGSSGPPPARPVWRSPPRRGLAIPGVRPAHPTGGRVSVSPQLPARSSRDIC